MNKPMTTRFLVASITATLAAHAASALAEGTNEGRDPQQVVKAEPEAADARQEITEATQVVRQMKQDPEVAQLLQQARAVFIVPDYGKAAAGVGVRGGDGVVLLRQRGQWSNPAFYNIGAISVGAQVGASAGSIALLFMSEEGVNKLTGEDSSFALDASSDLTIVDYSAAARGSTRGDVVLWSDTEGAFAGASIGVSDITRDEEQTQAFYGQQIATADVLSGKITGEKAQSLRDALATRVATK